MKDFEGEKDSFELKTIKKDDVSRALEICKVANYEFKQVTKVSESDAIAYLGEPITKYLASISCNFLYNSDSELNSLYKAAKELRLRGLENNIAAYLAAKIYVKLNFDDYTKKKTELGIKCEVTSQVSKQLKEKYAFLN